MRNYDINNPEYSWDLHTGDEVEVLASAFGVMDLRIQHYIEDLTRVTAEKERIGAELDIATQIQADMLPLAAMDETHYENYEMELASGDILYVYTDGVTEAVTFENEQFGEDRIIDAINAAPSDEAKVIDSQIRDHVAHFVGGAEQFDDMTMLCFKYFGLPS